MGKNKGYKSMIAVIVSIVMIIVLPASIFIGARKTVRYRFSGTAVEAEVTAAYKVGRSYHTEAMYTDEYGSVYIADTIYNGTPSVGDKFTGYYLPEDPYQLYRMPPAGLIVAFASVMLLIFVVCLVVLVKNIRVHRGNKLLSVYGKPVKATVLTVSRKGSSFKSDCLVSFTDENGTLQNAVVTFNKSIPVPDSECTVLYCLTKKGKLICDLIEL